MGSSSASARANRVLACCALLLVLLLAACSHRPVHTGEFMYVSAPQLTLRDRVAAVYSKTGVAKMGEKLEILEHQKRFVRVRTPRGEEGWVEQRSLIDESVFVGFTKLADDNRNTIVQGHGAARAELNIHLTPSRDSEKLFQLADGEKVEVLKRATAERPTPEQSAARQNAMNQAKLKPRPRPKSGEAKSPKDDAKNKSAIEKQTPSAPSKAEPAKPTESEEPAPKLYDDFWLVRSKEGHVGWVLARMIDLDVPLEVAQYAEGQRILGSFILNTIDDSEKGKQGQYLLLLNEPKDGLPYDFDQVRVFSWNLKRHRYETAYREHNLIGYFPARVVNEDFGKEGVMPVFYIRKQNDDGSVSERKYRLIGNIVRQVYAPGEEKKKSASAHPKSEKKAPAKPGSKTHKHKP